jgi:hypothetical protein
MKLIGKLVAFLLVFSLLFVCLRVYSGYEQVILMADLEDIGGVPWLYSAVCLIFTILAGFIIQSQWNHWNSLVGAVKGEVSALHQLWFWSAYFPTEVQAKARTAIRHYLATTLKEEWGQRREEESDAASQALASIRESVSEMFERPEFMVTAFSMFSDVLRHRENRLHFSHTPMPTILKSTVLSADGLVIALSLLIGVKHMWLDYLFTMSIALLAFSVYLVLDDLDSPLRPGLWHLTPEDYQRLLTKFELGSKKWTPSA